MLGRPGTVSELAASAKMTNFQREYPMIVDGKLLPGRVGNAEMRERRE